MVEAGAGALASAGQTSKPQCVSQSFYPHSVSGSAAPKGAKAQKRTCWIVNDDEFGTMFSCCRSMGLDVLSLLDPRSMQGGTEQRRTMLANHASQQPRFLLGTLKAPATHIGTNKERHFGETLSFLIEAHLKQRGAVVFVGPGSNRYLDAPGIKYLLQHDLLHRHRERWCCLKIKDKESGREGASQSYLDTSHTVLTNTKSPKLCNALCEHRVVGKQTGRMRARAYKASIADRVHIVDSSVIPIKPFSGP